MYEEAIKDYVYNFLENTFNDDVDKLKAMYYGLNDILGNIALNVDSDEDQKYFNKLNTSIKKIKDVIDYVDYNLPF